MSFLKVQHCAALIQPFILPCTYSSKGKCQINEYGVSPWVTLSHIMIFVHHLGPFILTKIVAMFFHALPICIQKLVTSVTNNSNPHTKAHKEPCCSPFRQNSQKIANIEQVKLSMP